MRLLKYLKAAFKNRWNLLAFGGALGFAILSGTAGVLVPLVLAGEIGYLALVGVNPRYQLLIDSEETARKTVGRTISTEQQHRLLIQALDPRLRQRFEVLRNRCLEIFSIAHELKGPGAERSEDALDDLQQDGLDRLLWIYLRMLYTRQSLDRFLATTSEVSIQEDIARIERRLKPLSKDSDNLYQAKKRQSLEDNLATCQQRLSNLVKARDSHELMSLEIERLENKIQTLSELAISRAEPRAIADQVDMVVSTMLEAEAAMRDLDFATDLHSDTDAVPRLLEEQKEEHEVNA